MSLNFETKNWKIELTLQALHIHPINRSSENPASNSAREPQHTLTNKPSVADYLLSKPLVHTQSSILEQE